MKTRAYHFLINSFLVVSLRSFKKLLTLATKHEAKLKANDADPVIAAMLAVFTPVLNAYRATDVNLMTALGFYKGETQTVEGLFDQLAKELLAEWEGKVFNFYPEGKPIATQLFPRKREPFNKGTYESRIQAISSFAQACNAFQNLMPLGTIVTAFHTQISSARALQLTDGEGKVELLRQLRENARLSLCQELYGNLGLLMHHYRVNPLEIERFFDFNMLRKKTSSGPQDITANGMVLNAQTQQPVVNATVKFILPEQQVVTVQTDAEGKFDADLGTFEDTINITMEVTAAGYLIYSESGLVEPGEDIEVNVSLVPMAPPTPPTP